MTPAIIALSGHDGVGKSSLAAEFSNRTGAAIMPLAEPLKRDAALHLGIPYEQVVAKPTPPWLREYMRAYGYAMREAHGADYWLQKWSHAVRARNPPVVIVDDVRHLNEYHYLREHGAFVFALMRTGTDPERTPDLLPIIREVFEIRDAVLFGPPPPYAVILPLDAHTPRSAARHMDRTVLTLINEVRS